MQASDDISKPRSQAWKTCLWIALFTIGLLQAADWLLDATLIYEPQLFPPHSTARFASLDFDAVASINAFGFRGTEQEIRSGQIVVVGDSFTFGFGGNDDAIWPRILEQRLRVAGDARAVYNLGAPGTDTAFHLWLARQFLEHRPSTVIVNVLIADDLQQVHEGRAKRNAAPGMAGLWSQDAQGTSRWLGDHFRGWRKLYARIKAWRSSPSGPAAAEPLSVTDGWSSQLKDLIERRSQALPAPVRAAALAGKINPALFQFADRYPQRSWNFWADLARSDPETVATVAAVHDELESLNLEVRAYGGELIVLCMPSGEFVDSEFTRNYRGYGASIPATNLVSLAEEDALGRLVQSAGALYVRSLNRFRASEEGDLFFPTDGHLNERGNRLIADILFESLAAKRAATPDPPAPASTSRDAPEIPQ